MCDRFFINSLTLSAVLLGAVSMFLISPAVAPGQESDDATVSGDVAAFAGDAAADSRERVEMRAEVDRDEVTVGDRILLTIRVIHPPDIEVSLPDVGAELGVFIVRDYEQGDREKLDDGRVAEISRYWLATYFTGDKEIPAVSATVREAEGARESVASAPIPVHVKSVIEGDVEDIKDLRAPAEIPYSYWMIAIIAVAVGLLLIGLLFLYHYLRVRRTRRLLSRKDEAALLSPRELALRELGRLTGADLLKQNRYKEFYIAVAEVVNRFLNGALGLPTFERTSEEIIRDLRRMSPGARIVQVTGDFLDDCDRVKFAKHVPTDSEISGIISAAYGIVDMVDGGSRAGGAPEAAPFPADGRAPGDETVAGGRENAGAGPGARKRRPDQMEAGRD